MKRLKAGRLARGALMCALALVVAGAAAAQTSLGPAPVPVEVRPLEAAPEVVASALPQAQSADYQRVFVDTGVSDVRVSDTHTVATMNRSPQSGCASNQYVFERERPKWLTETGRMLQAMKEGATVRISFTCRDGYQSINAIQFLSPAAGTDLAQASPRREQSVEAYEQRQQPLPLPGGGAADGASRTVPLP